MTVPYESDILRGFPMRGRPADAVQIKNVLRLHEMWLFNPNEGMRANLSDASLEGANLARANLGRAYLACANLRGASLVETNLWCAYLCSADLSGAKLARANLPGTGFESANLEGADLRDANLADANLRNANLAGANLAGANLGNALLSDANLANANLDGANLSGAKLRFATSLCKLAAARLRITPDGEYVGYKKLVGGAIATLRIPAHAGRSNGSRRKCRASEAIVVSIEDRNGQPIDFGFSLHNGAIRYAVGETVKPEQPFCEDRWQECASGIHHYLTREEAEAHFSTQ